MCKREFLIARMFIISVKEFLNDVNMYFKVLCLYNLYKFVLLTMLPAFYSFCYII